MTERDNVIRDFNQARVVPSKPINHNFAKSFVVENNESQIPDQYKSMRKQATPEDTSGAKSRQSSKSKYAHTKNKS